MTRIVFYRHERADGGLRNGIEVNGISQFESFREGDSENDPALLWYIDLEFEGDSLAEAGDAVRNWLADHVQDARHTLNSLSDEISAGFDPELRPFRRTIKNWSGCVTLSVTVSAVDRIAARGMSQNLEETAKNWNETLSALEPLVSI